MTQASGEPNAPFCSNCGYDLSALTESSRCPECGRPLVEVLTRRHRESESGKRYRSSITIGSLPLIDIAIGPKHGQMRGKARGILAIGDVATGVVAIGGLARGVVAIGGLAIGGFSIGGGAFGLFSAIGGWALGGVAAGGGAVGAIAKGGGAVGIVADGGGALGLYARGGGAFGRHTIDMAGNAAPEATRVFDALAWLLGSGTVSVMSFFHMALILMILTLGLGGIISLWAVRKDRRHRREGPPIIN